MSEAYCRLAEPVQGDRWGPAGPPLEAYSRTTERERFRPLHAFADRVLSQLEAVFNVNRSVRSTADLDFNPPEDILGVMKVYPADEAAAPVVIGTTTYPGLAIRCGYWMVERFPACGCDACNETAESEAYRFEDVLVAVTQGVFREFVVLPVLGAAWYEYELRTGSTQAGGRSRLRLSRARARELIREHGRRVEWKPWPRRY